MTQGMTVSTRDSGLIQERLLEGRRIESRQPERSGVGFTRTPLPPERGRKSRPAFQCEANQDAGKMWTVGTRKSAFGYSIIQLRTSVLGPGRFGDRAVSPRLPAQGVICHYISSSDMDMHLHIKL
jgi:hypothetical protein